VSGAKLTRAGSMLGTPGFMPPEQILGGPLDGRADLYALGCCAWWLLAGGEVFERDAEGSRILHRHVYDPVPPLAARVRGWCPAELEAVIAACLAKAPGDRPANARELAARLRAIRIPPEHAWTRAHAETWWARYRQHAPAAPVAAAAPAEVQEIMPGRPERGRVRGASAGGGAAAATVAASAKRR
jgi:serine/threonine-protein kinase